MCHNTGASVASAAVRAGRYYIQGTGCVGIDTLNIITVTQRE